jgi:hypothetical protein
MGLADEYAYLGITFENSTYPNCWHEFSGSEDIPCSKWKDVPGTGCYPGCVYDNWYRPTKGFVLEDEPTDDIINVSHSIMRGDLIDGQQLRVIDIYFDPVSERYLRQRIEALN